MRFREFKDLFFSLASMTTPHGHEAWCWPWLPSPTNIDALGNYLVVVPSKNKVRGPRIMFSSHLDTAASGPPTPVSIHFDGSIAFTDGKTILGADDKIGAAIMVGMIEAGIPGSYVFHVGEERGMIGSTEAAKSMEDKDALAHDACIAFDRYGYDSIITHQCGSRTCSDAFGRSLMAELNDKHIKLDLDPTGSFTDSYAYEGVIGECTNVSVGYDNHHTTKEWVNLQWAYRLMNRLCEVDWARRIEIKREPGEYDPRDWYRYGTVRTYSRWNVNRQIGDVIDDLEDEVPLPMCDGDDGEDDGPTRAALDGDLVDFACTECGLKGYMPVDDIDCSFCPECGTPVEPFDESYLRCGVTVHIP